MKKLARFTALLLAGMMLLTMLTACGGGGQTPDPYEKKITDIEDALRGLAAETLGKTFSGNEMLRAAAKSTGEERISATGTVDGAYGRIADLDDQLSEGYKAYYRVLCRTDGEKKAESMTNEQLEEFLTGAEDPNERESLKGYLETQFKATFGGHEDVKASIKDLEVGAVRKENGTIYFVMAYIIKNPA